VLQAKDVQIGFPIASTADLPVVSQAPVRSEAYLKKGDVVLVARASGPGSFRSAVFEIDTPRVVASGSLLIVRPNTEIVLPEYVSVYLNSNEGQRQLGEKLSGATIKAISRSALEDIQIPLPSIETQRTIVALDQNIRKKEQLYARKTQIERSMLNYLFQTKTLQ
jgi:restriction endonuclease S subunit